MKRKSKGLNAFNEWEMELTQIVENLMEMINMKISKISFYQIQILSKRHRLINNKFNKVWSQFEIEIPNPRINPCLKARSQLEKPNKYHKRSFRRLDRKGWGNPLKIREKNMGNPVNFLLLISWHRYWLHIVNSIRDTQTPANMPCIILQQKALNRYILKANKEPGPNLNQQAVLEARKNLRTPSIQFTVIRH